MSASYSVRKSPRSFKIGNTWSTKSLNPWGSTLLFSIKPSAAPFSNQACMESATWVGVPMNSFRGVVDLNAISRRVRFSSLAVCLILSVVLSHPFRPKSPRSGKGASRS